MSDDITDVSKEVKEMNDGIAREMKAVMKEVDDVVRSITPKKKTETKTPTADELVEEAK